MARGAIGTQLEAVRESRAALRAARAWRRATEYAPTALPTAAWVMAGPLPDCRARLTCGWATASAGWSAPLADIIHAIWLCGYI